MSKAYKRYIKSEKGQKALKRYETSEKRRAERRKTRKNNHEKHRKEDLARDKAHYERNKDYHRQKNKEYYRENGEKWKKRRAEISLEWTMNKCSSTLIEKSFESLGASLTVKNEITFPQLCSLIKLLGYNPKDVTYPAFITRWKYFDKKRTP